MTIVSQTSHTAHQSGPGSVCVAKSTQRIQASPKVHRRQVAASGKASVAPPRIQAPWEPSSWAVGRTANLEGQTLREERDALLKRCKSLEEDTAHYKAQASSAWSDFTGARQRILGMMETIEGLESELRAEKLARTEAENKLNEALGKPIPKSGFITCL